MSISGVRLRSGRSASSALLRAVAAGLLAGFVVVVAACAGSSSRSTTSNPADGAAPSSTVVAPPTSIRVLAASSLASVLPDLVAGFRTSNPNVTVETSTGASSAIVEQVRAGVAADVVLTADQASAEAASRAGATQSDASRSVPASPVPFATNTMVIAVPAGNPGEVRTLEDLSNPDFLVGLCAPQVPCGKYARQRLTDAGVTPSVDTEEPDARSLMAKIASGDLDAGLVYRTDVLAAGPTALVVPVPGTAKVPVTYFAVERTQGAGAEFVDYLRGPGRTLLKAAGFGLP